MPGILNQYVKLAVGDNGYTASVMNLGNLWHLYCFAPSNFKQSKKLITWWQHKLLTICPKVETIFDHLKEYLHLFRAGYLLHYIRILLSYQTMANF
jgi:hypothetical protein